MYVKDEKCTFAIIKHTYFQKIRPKFDAKLLFKNEQLQNHSVKGPNQPNAHVT